jgi:hypothetical protein
MRPRSTTIEASSVEEYIEKSRKEVNLSQRAVPRSRGKPSLRYTHKFVSVPLSSIIEEDALIERDDEERIFSYESDDFMETSHRKLSENELKTAEGDFRNTEFVFEERASL